MTDLHLTEVKRLPEEQSMRLTWSDGYTRQLTYRYLAGNCPCAGCQGHGGRIVFKEPRPGVEPESIQPVGRYAISIVWKGGCRTGIYSFVYLRELAEGGESGS